MDLMAIRRKMLAEGLPFSYKRIAWLESTGEQYIDTGVSLGADDFFIECEFEKTYQPSSESAIFSIWRSGYNYWNLFITAGRNMDVYTSAHHFFGNVTELNTRYHTSLTRTGNEWTAKIDTGSISWTFAPPTVNNISVKLFTRGDTPDYQSSNTHIRMYWLKIYRAGELVGHYVPCIRKTDSKPGMYDFVTKSFFTNKRGDEFIIPT